MKGISVVINTLNEENNIKDCIYSVKDFADEIVICDMYSEDKTVEIAKQLGCRVVLHKKTGFVEPARFFAISQAEYSWILVLDADERMTKDLAGRLIKIAEEDKMELVLFGSLYNYFGGYVRYGGFYNTRWPRFFKKEMYIKTYSEDEVMVHQNFRNLERFAKNKVMLPPDHYIIHEAYPTVEKYIQKTLGMYARIEAEELIKRGVKYSLFNLFYKPFKSFIASFIWRKGFLDGLRGFILCTLYSVFHFAIWANIWFIEKKNKV